MTGQAEQSKRYLRRAQAAKRIREKHNYPCTPRTLAKKACEGSDGPPFVMNGRYPLYPIEALDLWAVSKRGPLVRSTAEARSVVQSKSEKAEGTKVPVPPE
jgi:hypothetical protein